MKKSGVSEQFFRGKLRAEVPNSKQSGSKTQKVREPEHRRARSISHAERFADSPATAARLFARFRDLACQTRPSQVEQIASLVEMTARLVAAKQRPSQPGLKLGCP
jgi:hypothetical protein